MLPKNSTNVSKCAISKWQLAFQVIWHQCCSFRRIQIHTFIVFSYKRIKQENCKKKESIIVIHKNNNYESGSWLERSSLTNSLFTLNMLTESVDLTSGTFSNDDDDNNNNVKKQLVLWEKQLLCTCIALFSIFFWRPLHEYDVDLLTRRFMEDVDILRQIFPSLFEHWISP